jgi:hypothetical protein
MTTPSDPDREGQPYEPMPSAPPPRESAPAIARPMSITAAFAIWAVTGLIYVLGAVITLVQGDDFFRDAARQTLEAQNRQPTAEEIDDLASLIRTIGLIFNLVFAVLILAFAWVMRAGRNWARIGLCVVGGVTLILTLLGIGSLNLIVVIQLALIIVAIFFMFRRDANEFFAANRRLMG